MFACWKGKAGFCQAPVIYFACLLTKLTLKPNHNGSITPAT